MEPGLSGASGQPVARSARTGGAENAQPHPLKMGAKTVVECFWIPKTALMASVCKVSQFAKSNIGKVGKGG